MNGEVFADRISAAAAAASDEDWVTARALFEALDAELVQAPDPELYGWVHFYRFKAAYMTKDWDAAFALLAGPRFVTVMSETNGSWMASVGAEVAARLGQFDEAVFQGRRCLEIRRRADDTAGSLMAARTMCAILESCDGQHRAGEFASELVGLAKELGDDDSAAYGYRALARSLTGNPNPLRVDELIEARGWLEANRDNEWASEALAVVRDSRIVAARRATRDQAKFLWEAALSGDLRAVLLHLDSGLDANTPWTLGRNALHAAALQGHLGVLVCLLDRGARPNIRTVQGRSALHFAAEFGHQEIADELVARGAEPTLEDMFGLTPIDLAKEEGHEAIHAQLVGL